MTDRDPGSIAVEWTARLRPLTPSAVAATGACARKLAQRVLQRDDATLARLRGVAGRGLLALLGEADELPWVEGVVYLGRDASAPALLLPTAMQPSVPAGLFERAILASGHDATPVAVLPRPAASFSVAAARPVTRERLTRWLEGET